MAYTAVPSKSTSGTWSGDEHNTYIRDNFSAGIPGLMTTKGDIVSGTGTNAATRVGIGLDGQVLGVNSAATGGMSWFGLNTKAQAQYKVNSTQSVPNNLTTLITNYGSKVYDTLNSVTTGAAWKFTVASTGYYWVSASAMYLASTQWGAAEFAKLHCYIGSTANVMMVTRSMKAAASGGYRVYLSGGALVSLTPGQTVSIRTYQNSGATLTLTNDGDYGRVSISGLF